MILSRYSKVWSHSLSLLRMTLQISPRPATSKPLWRYSSKNCRLIRCYVQAPSTVSVRLNPFQRVQKYIRDNPYTKFSLTICGIVLALSIAVELGKKYKRKRPLSIVGSLPSVGHYTVQRSSEVNNIVDKLKSLRKRGGFPLVYVTGCSGVGKSELVSQYVKQFTETCYKWFGLKSVQPVVLFINGRNKMTLDLSLREVAASLGLKEEDQLLLSQVHSKLLETKLPWLIVVDGLDGGLLSEFACEISALPQPSDWKSPDGAVVVTTTSSLVPQENQLAIKERLSSEEYLLLLTKLSKTEVDEKTAIELVEEVKGHPISVALAASTIGIYRTFLERVNDSLSPATRYVDVLKQKVADGTSVADAVMDLYIEAAITDPRFRHTFDLLGSCDLSYPVPSSLIGNHLTSSFYSVTKEELTPPNDDQVAKFKELTGANQGDDESWFGLLKALLPFLSKKPPSQEQMAEILNEADDSAFFIRECPLLAFKKFNSGFEYVEVHDLAQECLPLLFLKYTAPRMDKARLEEDEAKFERGAWFRQFRKFDPAKSLENYHHSLPGISAPGVMTSEQYNKHPGIDLGSSSPAGSKVPSTTDQRLSYSEYEHLISHHHRVVSTMHSELKASSGEYRDVQLKKYLQPHFTSIKNHPVISSSDCLLCKQALVSTEATGLTDKTEKYQELVARYEDVITEQRRIFGAGSQIVARTMTDLADFKYSHRDITGAHQLLLDSLTILEKVPTRYADEDFKFDIGLTYTSLAYVYDDLGDKKICKDLLERSLSAYQTLPKDGQVPKRQRKLVASGLTNVAHAYLSLGDILMAKKFVDLASVAHQNIYVEAHPESLRVMNVSSNIYALLGDKSESIRLRTEAGKIKAKLESKPLLV